MTFDLAIPISDLTSDALEYLTFNLRQATQAVIFLLMSGTFLSPKDSRICSAAVEGAMFDRL